MYGYLYSPCYLPVKKKCDCGESLLIDPDRNIIAYSHTEYSSNDNLVSRTDRNGIVAYGTIKNVKKFHLTEHCNSKCIYEVYCTPYNDISNEKIIYVSEREFGQATMVNQLQTQGGMIFPSKQSYGKIATLIVNYLIACNLIEEYSLPYFSGWQQNTFCYCTQKAILNIDLPYLNNTLIIDSKINIDVALHNVYNAIKHTKNSYGLILFILMIYGMLYSVFSDLKLYIGRLINLSGSMADKAAQFMNIYNKDNINFIGLNCNIPNLKKRIFKSKDEVLILKGRVDESKASLLCDIFCHGIYSDVKINGNTFQTVRQSLCLVISDLMSNIVPPNLIWEFNIEHFDANIDVSSFGIGMKYIIETAETYKKENKFSKIIQRYRNQDIDDCNESEKNEFVILHTVYEFISAAFDVYGLDIKELLPDDRSSDFIADFVFNNDTEVDEDAITRKLRHIFIDTALNEPFTQKYTTGMEISNTNKPLVLYDSNNMYISYEQLLDISKIHFSSCTSSKRLLCVLKDADALKCNNRNSIRLSVKISGNKSARSNWLGIKRNFFESPYWLPLFPCSEITLESDYKPMLLGTDALDRNIFIPINSNALINNHIGITGNSGTGKSNTTISLICELVKQKIPVIIVDSANSLNKDISSENFRALVREKLRIVSVKKDRLPLNPFAIQSKSVDDKSMSESNFDTILRGSNTLANAFNLNDTQKHLIQQIAMSLIESGNVSLKHICRKLKSDKHNTHTAQACLNKLYMLSEADILDESSRSIDWYSYIKNSVVYFSMDNIPDEGFKQAIGEFILSDIWTYAKQYGDKSTPFAIIFDEVSNFSITESSSLTKMLKEGRKYGIMCIWNTQSFGTKFDDEQRATLSQAATMLYFNSSEPKEVEYISSRLPNCGKCLKHLKKSGECIAYGTFCDDNGNTYFNKELYAKIPLVSRKTKED